MNTNDISILLKKADELRSLFVLGQRVIPFLEEIFVFVQDIQPMLEEINHSINDNIKKMPGASEKLSKVTEANEMATNEIMDILDKIFVNTDKLTQNNKQISDHYNKIIDKPVRLLEIIRRGIVSGGDLTKAVPQIDSAIAKIKAFDSSNIKPLENDNNDIINEINNDSSGIMMSLQVQDITSQQIAAVDHMLSAVQGKLAEILKHFKNTDVSSLVDLDTTKTTFSDDSLETNTTKFHREIAFDPNAIGSYEDNEKRQDMVDSLIAEGVDDFQDTEETNDVQDKNEQAETGNNESLGDVDYENISSEDSVIETQNEEELSISQAQDDIDKIFDESSDELEVETESEIDDSSFSDLDDNPDPSDIDALFGGVSLDDDEDNNEETDQVADVSSDEEMSETQAQDDIDKMFDSPQEVEDEVETENANNDDFDLSKFDDLGDNPDPSDIDALFNGS
ncbi:protein phosphatase CheZ [Candidatus Kapabacteria bacterium]|nr:protein phosphatase CheZ [Candidatus Kapabacteria bacterium]